jgi:uncharacterized protein
MTEQNNFYGINANSLQEAFRTAVIRNQTKEVKLLLIDGADINAKLNDYDEITALHFAAFQLMPKLVDFLIANGANLDAISKNRLTPLMNACSRGGVKGGQIALKLIAAGAKVNYVRESDGQTALKFAVGNFISKSCSVDVVQALINNGAMVDGPSGTDQTPLMLAARTNNTEIIELLLKNGADPKLECGLPWANGLTAEYLAELEGCKKAFKYLSEYRKNGYQFI